MTQPRFATRPASRSRLGASLLAAATFALAVVILPASAQTSAPMSSNAQAAAPETPYHGDVVEQIIAQVNDRVISTSDYQRAIADLNQAAKQHNWSDAEVEQQRKDLLRDLIDNQLLLSKGKQLGITGELETERELDEIRKQNHLPSMEALEKAVADQGLNFADFKASIQNHIIVSQVVRDEVGRRINITQGEEQRYYDAHKDQFTIPETVNLSEILIPTADPDNAAQVAEAQKKADALEAQLKAGKNFADVAKADSGGSTAAQGGELGDYKAGQLAKVLEDDTFSLAPGQFTAPVRTRQGYVILKVNAKHAAGLQPFDQVRSQVEDAVGEQMMQPALRQYLTTLREQAYIDIRPGYTDVAASQNELHPALYFSAYQPPQKKKKKKEVRTRFTGRGRARMRPETGIAKNGAAPAGVASLAEVQGSGTAASADTAHHGRKAIARVEKPGKREKVRFGQAPRETLPAMAAQTHDAGASEANGNSSEAESAAVQQPGTSSTNLQYENGESASATESTEPKRQKTRYSQVAEREHKAKVRRAKQEAAAATPPPPDRQEISDRQVQSQPLGLRGDTATKKKPVRINTGVKTRYSETAGKNKKAAAAPGQGTTLEPNQEGSPARTPGTTPPVETQTTPTGSGDPLGNPTPAPQTQPQ